MITLHLRKSYGSSRLVPALIALVGLAILFPCLAQASTLTILDVPGADPAPGLGTSGQGNNSRGDVVGFVFYVGEDSAHGFVFANGAFMIFDFPGAMSTSAFGINSRGDIVGVYDVDGIIAHGFLRSGSNFTTIDFPGAAYTFANGINASGDIVGFYDDTLADDDPFTVHGFLLDKHGVFTPIDYPGAIETEAYG